MTNLPAFAKYL